MSKVNPSQSVVHVIEDDAALNDAYRMILESKGYTVVASDNGRTALESLESAEKQPAVILLDLHMPIMSGLEFLRAFNAPSHPETTVVVFTNYDTGEDIDEAYRLGAERYILKARATPKELLRLVDAIIAEHEAA